MFSRRSFFRRAAAIIAAVALAPEIAFGVKLPVQPKLNLDECIANVYSIMYQRRGHPAIDLYGSSESIEELKKEYPEAFGDFQPVYEPRLTHEVRPIGVYEQLRSES